MKIENLERLVDNLYDKTIYYTHKQTLNYGLVSKKVRRIIKLNQKSWLKPYIDMNTDLRKKGKNDFEIDFFSS